MAYTRINRAINVYMYTNTENANHAIGTDSVAREMDDNKVEKVRAEISDLWKRYEAIL